MYTNGGEYTVSLTVTDDDNATGQSSETVTVSAPSTGDFTLSAAGYKVRGLQKVDLTWSGAGSDKGDVYRDGATIASDVSGGKYTDDINNKGGGSYTYQVCEQGQPDVCSNTALVAF
jgi:serine protease